MLTVACVLRSGGEYRIEHVLRLIQQVQRHLDLPYQFVCLTDQPREVSALCDVVALPHDWPGWFSKLSLFKPGIIELPALYLDLDTLILGPIADLAGDNHTITMLRNFWQPDRVGSAVMAWTADLAYIYDKFAHYPTRFVKLYATPDHWGDQGFIRDYIRICPDYWQDRYPGRVVSYRRHCIGGKPPAGASIVCYGGKVRPWTSVLGQEVYATYQ